MEYVYAAAILHKLDQEINEENVTAVLEAAGADVSESRVKALIAALEDVDIDEAISEASAIPSGETEAAAVPEGEEEPGGEPGEIEEPDETLPDTTEEETEMEEDEDEDEDDLGGLFS